MNTRQAIKALIDNPATGLKLYCRQSLDSFMVAINGDLVFFIEGKHYRSVPFPVDRNAMEYVIIELETALEIGLNSDIEWPLSWFEDDFKSADVEFHHSRLICSGNLSEALIHLLSCGKGIVDVMKKHVFKVAEMQLDVTGLAIVDEGGARLFEIDNPFTIEFDYLVDEVSRALTKNIGNDVGCRFYWSYGRFFDLKEAIHRICSGVSEYVTANDNRELYFVRENENIVLWINGRPMRSTPVYTDNKEQFFRYCIDNHCNPDRLIFVDRKPRRKYHTKGKLVVLDVEELLRIRGSFYSDQPEYRVIDEVVGMIQQENDIDYLVEQSQIR